MAGWSDKYKKSINCDNPKGFSQRAHCQGKKKKVKEENNPRIPRKPGQPANSKKHSDLYTDENPKGTIHGLGFKDVATAKASVSKIRNSSRSHAHKIQAAVAMEQRAREMGKTSEAAVFRKYINTMKKKTKKMNEGYDADNFNKLKEKIGSAKKHRKPAVDESKMDEEKQNGKCKAGSYYCYTDKVCKPIPKGFMVDPKGMLRKENGASISEEGLRDWFGKSKSKDGKGGWVNVVTGGTCASDEPGEGTPKCVSSAKRASMSKKERLSAARRKKKADPGQQSKSGAAKPTYVSTDPKPKKKMNKEEFVALPLHIEVPSSMEAFNAGLMFRESLGEDCGMLFVFNESGEKSFHMKNTTIPLDIAFINEDGVIETIKELEPLNESSITSDANVLYALEVNRGWFEANDVNVGDKVLNIDEAKDKKGKGSGTKDACYHKVKSRYSVWPSAYASGALVKCRKVGAANWGNSSKKEGFSPAQLAALESIGAIEINEAGKKCWKGYKKAGTQKLFGKTYNRCVKANEETIETADGKAFAEVTDIVGPANMSPVVDTNGVWKGTEVQEAVRIPAKTGNIIAVTLVWKGKYYMLRMFFPSASRPTRADVQSEIGKVYPGSKLSTFTVSDYEPGQPFLQVAEGAAWTKKEGKNKKGGLNEKGRKSYERENPGSDLKAPSKKVGNPRRASFCARMKGMKAKLTSKKTANDPDSRINKSLRAWNC